MAQFIGLILSKVAALAGVEATPVPRELVEEEDITAIPKVSKRPGTIILFHPHLSSWVGIRCLPLCQVRSVCMVALVQWSSPNGTRIARCGSLLHIYIFCTW